MRVAILLSLAAWGLAVSAARADEALIKVTLESGPVYIVPESYATGHQAELTKSIPGAPKIDAFWTPSEADVIVANRVLKEMIQDAAKDPTLLFPDLAQDPNVTASANLEAGAQLQNERYELSLVSSHYERYSRQYVGIVIDGKKLIFCNYLVAPRADPAADYVFIEKVFANDGTVHFLQGRVDAEEKTCTNVSIIGSWQRSSD